MQQNVKMYFERIRERLANYFPPKARVLDVGCAEGDDAVLLQQAGHTVLAVDIQDQPQAWQARTRPGLDFQVASAEALPFPDNTFDVVWAKDALHHMEHPERALQEMQRVAKPDGVLLLIEANRYNPVFYLHMTLMEGHAHFTRKRFRSMLAVLDPAFGYQMLESRCLPTQAKRWLQALEWFQNTVEKIPWFAPWLTYQVGIVRKAITPAAKSRQR